MLDFEGRVAVITGGGRGLGQAHATTLAARGCRVVVNDLPGDQGGSGLASQVALEIESCGGTAIAVEGSVTDDAQKIVDAAIEAFGQIDIVINNAGNFDPRPFDEFTPEEWPSQLNVHLFGSVNLCRAAWPHLKAAARGKVINTISSGVYGNAYLTGYATAKAALLGFSRALTYDGAAFGIDVNCVFPGASTRMQASIDDSLQPFLKSNFQPERVAAFVAWLVHQDTSLSGEMFEVGGGTAARIRFAHHAFVKTDEDSPEAWAQLADRVMSDDNLEAISTTMDMAMHQFAVVDPDFASQLSNILDV